MFCFYNEYREYVKSAIFFFFRNCNGSLFILFQVSLSSADKVLTAKLVKLIEFYLNYNLRRILAKTIARNDSNNNLA